MKNNRLPKRFAFPWGHQQKSRPCAGFFAAAPWPLTQRCRGAGSGGRAVAPVSPGACFAVQVRVEVAEGPETFPAVEGAAPVVNRPEETTAVLSVAACQRQRWCFVGEKASAVEGFGRPAASFARREFGTVEMAAPPCGQRGRSCGECRLTGGLGFAAVRNRFSAPEHQDHRHTGESGCKRCDDKPVHYYDFCTIDLPHIFRLLRWPARNCVSEKRFFGSGLT